MIKDAHSMNTSRLPPFRNSKGAPSRVSPGNLQAHVQVNVEPQIVEGNSTITEMDWITVSIRSYHRMSNLF